MRGCQFTLVWGLEPDLKEVDRRQRPATRFNSQGVQGREPASSLAGNSFPDH